MAKTTPILLCSASAVHSVCHLFVTMFHSNEAESTARVFASLSSLVMRVCWGTGDKSQWHRRKKKCHRSKSQWEHNTDELTYGWASGLSKTECYTQTIWDNNILRGSSRGETRHTSEGERQKVCTDIGKDRWVDWRADRKHALLVQKGRQEVILMMFPVNCLSSEFHANVWNLAERNKWIKWHSHQL